MPAGERLPLLDPYHRIKHITEEELPHCPRCESGLQRPAVVWFGESLDEKMLDGINSWMFRGKVVPLFPLLFPFLSSSQPPLVKGGLVLRGRGVKLSAIY